MGSGMNKILPGLYVGSVRDAKDRRQLEENNITHILSIHDHAKPVYADKQYLCIHASDNSAQDLTPYFTKCIDFIHRARIKGGNVLVHCLAGVSRSVTISVVYIMTVTNLGWRDALNSVRGARHSANPNFGFQRQLLAFQHDRLQQERQRLLEELGACSHPDVSECQELLVRHQHWVLHGDQAANRDPEADLYNLPHKAYQTAKCTSSSAHTESQATDAAGTGANRCRDSVTDNAMDSVTDTTSAATCNPSDVTALDKFFQVNDRFLKKRLDNGETDSDMVNSCAASQAPTSAQLGHPKVTPAAAAAAAGLDGIPSPLTTDKHNPVTVDELFSSSDR